MGCSGRGGGGWRLRGFSLRLGGADRGDVVRG